MYTIKTFFEFLKTVAASLFNLIQRYLSTCNSTVSLLMVAQYFITWLHYPKNCLTSPSGVDFQTHEKACSSDLYGVCGENAGTPLFLVAG